MNSRKRKLKVQILTITSGHPSVFLVLFSSTFPEIGHEFVRFCHFTSREPRLFGFTSRGEDIKNNNSRINEATVEKQGTFLDLDPLSAILINACGTIGLGI